MTSDATLRILLVRHPEDDLRALLDPSAGKPPSVVEAAGRDEALRLLRERPVDAVVVGDATTDGTGLELLRHEEIRGAGLPVVVVTAGGRAGELAAAAAGAADSVDRAEAGSGALLRTVRDAVERHRRARAERRSRALLEKSRDLITVLDARGSVEQVSPSARAVLGLDPEKLLGAGLLRRVHREDRRRVRRGFRDLAAGTQETWSFRCRIRAGDGSWRTMDNHAQELLSDPGVQGIVVNSWDATELARVEERLRERERLLGTVVSSLPMVVFALDGEGVLTLTDGRGLDVAGLRPGDLVGSSVFEQFADQPDVLDHAVRALGGESFRTTVQVAGRSFEVWLTSRGPGAGATGIAVDVTERARAERQRGRMLAVLDHSPDFVGLSGADGTMIHVNPAGRRMTGLGEDRALDDVRLSALHPEWAAERLQKEAIPAALRHSSWQGENALLAPDGTEIRVWEVVVAHRDDDGEVSFFSTVASDLREQERAAERIRFQAALLNAVGQAVIATDLEGRVTYWNRAAEQIYGWDQDEAMGRRIQELTGAARGGERSEEVMEELRRGQPWTGEFRVRDKDGNEFPGLGNNAPLRDGAGKLVGIVGVSSDLRGRKQLEAELREAQKMEAIGRLAGGVAHDFNNLLTAIRGHVDLALQAVDPSSRLRADLQEVDRAAERAADLTRQLLAFSRRQVFEVRTLDLRTAVSEMEGMLARLVPETIHLSVDLPDEPAAVRADPTQIQQVALNLVLNAVDALVEGGRLEIRVRRVEEPEEAPEEIRRRVAEGPWVSLSVSDSGVGMAQEVMDRIFEPFFTTKEVGKGTGLGLAMVFGVVKQSGGEVVVESVPGAGSTFQVLLPAVPMEGPVEEPPPTPVRRSGTVERVARERETVLVVEDDEAVRRFTTRVLLEAGFGIVQARNGVEGLDKAAAYPWPIHLVVSDVVMPEMGGPELVERLREQDPDVRVVLISGYAREELPSGLDELGVPFLAKPFEVPELLRVVREALDG